MDKFWCEWDTLEAFENWHSTICDALVYPKQSVSAASGTANENSVITQNYTNVIEVNGKWIALVRSEHTTDLTLTEKRPPTQKLMVEIPTE